ncbi:hypothetical protein AMYBAR_003421 [Amycolatopsis bartoniae]|uniref:Uncharacterized protein n=1 Tax=Amycolatopsis bartoniae TaxID=941986 RepID=A0A8H9ITU5_9PSEU|nr:hypothetical protein [Amycolatopsis bartoniae]TVT09951.1 hypothetical protein FNH07_06800 [Amycolatopsis bartoniae]GHF32242.1 hypothetical protein GCM10017566_00920 [Amycolatopsis bartoniae]
MRPAAVVFGWAGFNAVLAAIMFAYGESFEFIALYFLAVLGTVAVGLVVLFAHRRRRGPRMRMATSSRSAGYAALAAVLFGLGFLYTHWISYLALFPILLAVFEFRRERLPATVFPARTEVRSSPLVPPREDTTERVVRRVARVGTLVAVGLRVLSALRPGRRR